MVPYGIIKYDSHIRIISDVSYKSRSKSNLVTEVCWHFPDFKCEILPTTRHILLELPTRDVRIVRELDFLLPVNFNKKKTMRRLYITADPKESVDCANP